MGAGVSDWCLARAVSATGQLGVVSGTALDVILARRLQLGDPTGQMRFALAQFPVPGVADRIIDRYFVPGGKPATAPYKSKPLPSEAPTRAAEELIVAANFVEVFLAKQGHDHPVGINYLEKIQTPTLPSLYGAMLAGVDCVLMGAGIPRAIPGILDKLAAGQHVEMAIDVQGAPAGEVHLTRFDPEQFWTPDHWPTAPHTLTRPAFYAIVASAVLAGVLAKKASGKVNGFIIEGWSAGGHNAPPRGPLQLTSAGEPIYGDRDKVDLDAIRALGLPFWLAGSYAKPERIADALQQGAAGVQVATAFAYCQESGLDESLKSRVLAMSTAGQARVFTDPVASPTGFPFKVVQIPGSLSDPTTPPRTHRLCDLGYLRHAYQKPEGDLGWRCPAEPVEDFTAKGGKEDQSHGRLCVCNALLANIGLGQVRGTEGQETELPLVTSGDDVAEVARFLTDGKSTYSAADVVDYLLAGCADGCRV
jgi:nitronate monooxygenase